MYGSYPDLNGLPKIGDDFLKIQSDYDVIILTLDPVRWHLKLWKYRESEFLILNKMNLKKKWALDESRNFFFNILLNLDIDVLIVVKSSIISHPLSEIILHSLVLHMNLVWN